MSDEQVLTFSAVRRSIPIDLEMPAGRVDRCHLVEMSGAGRDAYLTNMSKVVKFDSKGSPVGLSSFDGVQANLLSRCFKKPNGEFFSVEEIQEFPAGLVNALFEKAQELNGLDLQAQEAAKND